MGNVTVLKDHVFPEGFGHDEKTGEMYFQSSDGKKHTDWYGKFLEIWNTPENKEFADQMSPIIGFAREHQALKDRMMEAADNGFEVFSYPRYLEFVAEMRIKYGIPEEAETDNVVTFKK